MRPGDDMDFVGTWSLTRWESRHGLRVDFPFGEDATGRLIYGADGYMAGFLMRANWPAASVDTPAHRNGFVAYSGRYYWNGHKVSHMVDFATNPTWVGTTLLREGQFNAERLNIVTISDRPDPVVHLLAWVRAT